jgi:hypothetical protein
MSPNAWRLPAAGSLALLAGLLAGCGAGRFKEYTSAEGRFRVLFPGTPKDAPDPDIPQEIKKVSLEERSGFYAVTYQDLAFPPGKTRDPDEQLDAACDRAVENLKAKRVSQTAIRLAGKYPGRDLVAEWPGGNGLVHYRLYLVDGRLYQVIVNGSKWWAESADARRFLDSFALTGD